MVTEPFLLQVSEMANGVSGDVEDPTDWVNNDGVEIMVDSGAHFTLISDVVFVKYCIDKAELFEPDVKPFSYGGKPIELVGYFEGHFSFKGNEADGKVMFLLLEIPF